MNARLARLGAVSLLTLAMAGCGALGPDYAVPGDAAVRQPAAQAAFLGAQEASFRREEPPGRWWHLYDDPRLDALVEDALARNASLRQAAANLARAQAMADEAGAQQSAQVGVDASPTYGHASGVQVLQPGARPANRWRYSGGISVSYQLDLYGQIQRAIEAAQDDAQAAQAAYDATRVAVAAHTVDAYAQLCGAGLQLASARHSLALQQDSLDMVEQLARAGRGTALDVSRARSQAAQLKAALPPLLAQQRIALYQLAALSGKAPAEMPAALAECDAAPRLAQALPVGDGASLLRRRPDIRRAERTLAGATARIGVATADLYPRISLGLSAGSAGPATLIGERGTFSLSAGPLISWTIPNTGAAQARIAQAEAGAQAALAAFDQTVLDALKETESALTRYARQIDRVAALAEARDDAKLAATQARTLFGHGKIDALQALDADRTLAATESALADAQVRRSTAEIGVFLALGGGWEDSAPGQAGKAARAAAALPGPGVNRSGSL